jgi:hypothetical protein
MSHKIFVCYYERNPLAANQREHWSIFVKAEDAEKGTIYEATGGTLEMKYNKKADVALTKSSTYKGSVFIGEIGEDRFKILDKTLANVPLPSSPMRLPPGERRRDCQDWVKDAVDALVEAEVLDNNAVDALDKIPVPS